MLHQKNGGLEDDFPSEMVPFQGSTCEFLQDVNTCYPSKQSCILSTFFATFRVQNLSFFSWGKCLVKKRCGLTAAVGA